MVIIDSIEEYNKWFPSIMDEGPIYVIPILVDTKAHPAINSLSVLFVYTEENSFAFTFNHQDARKLDVECLKNLTVIWNGGINIITPSKSKLMHLIPELDENRIYDADGMEYIKEGRITPSEKFHSAVMRNMQVMFGDERHVNTFIPLLKLEEYAQAHMKHMLQYKIRVAGFSFLNDVIIPTAHFIEASGVHVDRNIMIENFGQRAEEQLHGNLVFTQYNPYTGAGRVTNRFGGINYAALSKVGSTREAFTSRFDRGMMILIDFESFHLRLIAKMMQYGAPQEPMHEYLGKQYFGVDKLTPEQYDQGKQMTFQNLYSMHNAPSNIPFFQKARKYMDEMWKKINADGYITWLTTGEGSDHCIYLDRIHEPNAAKVFNYALQWMETHEAFRLMNQLRAIYTGVQSKVVMYTYDSILIDFALDDGRQLLENTVSILEDNGRYPVRIYRGKNYSTMVNMTNTIKMAH